MKKSVFRIIVLFLFSLFFGMGAFFIVKCGFDQRDDNPTYEIVVEIDGGTLTLEKCKQTAVVGEQALTLPKYRATSANGADLSALVSITDSLKSAIDQNAGTIVLRAEGVHVITYSVVDPASQKLLEYSFEITKFRQLFNYNNLKGEVVETVASGEQSCTARNDKQGIARFNMDETQLYYAEVCFNATTATQFLAGLAHVDSVSDSKATNANVWLASLVNASDNMRHALYKDVDYDLQKIDGTAKATSLIAGQAFKYAIARYGTTFYTFINDELVYEYVDETMADRLTAPGIFTVAQSGSNLASVGGIKITAIDYYKSTTAKDKIADLTGKQFGSDIEIDVGDAGWGDYDTPLD